MEDGGEDVFLSVVVPAERAALGPEDSTKFLLFAIKLLKVYIYIYFF